MTSARSALVVTSLVAVATFVVAYDGGGYSLASRSTLAVWVWWTIALGLALGIWPVITAAPAFLVALGASVVLVRVLGNKQAG